MARLKNAVYIDVETTGLDILSDRIVQVCINAKGKTIYTNINPERDIPQEATDVHGLKKKDVKKSPKFAEIADEVIEILEEAKYIVAYNANFDLNFLREELKRCNYTFNPRKYKVVDPLAIHRHFNKNDLKSLYKSYTGDELDNAHDAEADVNATIGILSAQIKSYNIKNISDLIQEVKEDCNRFFSDKEDEVSFNKGKYKGNSVDSILDTDPDYFIWLYENCPAMCIEDRYIVEKCILEADF